MVDMVDIERLQAFLYFIMRDHLPCGEVVKIVKEIEACEVKRRERRPLVNPAKDEEPYYIFTNKHLAAYAAELCNRLMGWQPAGYVTEREEGTE